MTAIDVRRLDIADAAAYRALRLRGLAEHPTAFTSDASEEAARPLAWTERRLAAREDAPNDVVLGAFTPDGALVGAIGLDVDPRRKARHIGRVFGMYVPPEHGREGIGRRLLEAIVGHARSAGLEQLVLSVTSDNAAARSLYARAGFVAFAVAPGAIKVDGRNYDKVQMMKRLNPISSNAAEAR
jgi:RimJ/RimL family protein N-acetyltransferase